MYDHELTSEKIWVKVRQYIRNGNELNCVGEEQNDFDCVEQANIGTSKMDHGMESNDGQEMDQGWNQVFAMMEQVSLSNQVSEFGLES